MRISLAEEIREISQVAPKDFDPDELHFEPEGELDGDQPNATEHYLLDLGYVAICVNLFFIRFVFHPTHVILVLPPFARPKIAYLIRNTLESVYRGHSCLTMMKGRNSFLHLIPKSRIQNLETGAKQPKRTNPILQNPLSGGQMSHRR